MKKVYVVRQEMLDGTFQYVDETCGWVKSPKQATTYSTWRKAFICATSYSNPPSAGRVHVASRMLQDKAIDQKVTSTKFALCHTCGEIVPKGWPCGFLFL